MKAIKKNIAKKELKRIDKAIKILEKIVKLENELIDLGFDIKFKVK